MTDEGAGSCRHRRGKLPDRSLPDRVVIADNIPHAATGKVLKAELRRLYAGD